MFKDGGLTANNRDVRRSALRRCCATSTWRRARRLHVRPLGGREGAEYGGCKNVWAALDRYDEALDLLCEYVREQGYSLRFAIEPKPNDRAATSCFRPSDTPSP